MLYMAIELDTMTCTHCHKSITIEDTENWAEDKTFKTGDLA
jgi:hypothetical protein